MQEVGHWREQETFPIIEELLKKRFPDIKIIPGAELPCYEDFGTVFERKLPQQTKLYLFCQERFEFFYV